MEEGGGALPKACFTREFNQSRGGVAEILNSLVPLMNNINMGAHWRILNGNPNLFTVTKKFHNAL